MPGRASAKRYAQAAFDLALQRGQQDQWYEHLVLINQTLENPEFMAFLEHAKIPLRSKVQALEEVFQSVDPLVRNMLSLLVSRGSVGLVPEVEQRYQRLLNEHMGREQVEVRSAVPLEDAERDRVARFLTRLINKEVVLDSQVDPAILGGLVIRVGDKLIDGSTRTRLDELGRQLQRNSVAMGA